MTLLDEAKAMARETGKCIACDDPLPEKKTGGRKPIRCNDPQCKAYYHLLYDLERETKHRKGATR